MVYETAEDSELLGKFVKKYAAGSVLDMGTGSGYLAAVSGTKKAVKSVVGVDVDPSAIEICKKTLKDKKYRFVLSDLFKDVKGVFDTIVFNPPYLPDDPKEHDIALHGGKHGYETIVRFLNTAGDHLTSQGKILLLYSSLSKEDKVMQALERNLFEHKQVAKTHLFFEDLFVIVITKNEVRRALEKKGVKSFAYLDEGQRGIILTGTYKNKKVAIKIKQKGSDAIDRMKNEAKWLAHLRGTGMCPQLLFSGPNYLCYEFIDGEVLPSFLTHGSGKDCLEVLRIVLGYCRKLDELNLIKEEFTRPLKHVFIRRVPDKMGLQKESELSVTMIDFERMKFSLRPNNVTQFCQYLNMLGKNNVLKGRVEISSDILSRAKDYKSQMTASSFEGIEACLKRH